MRTHVIDRLGQAPQEVHADRVGDGRAGHAPFLATRAVLHLAAFLHIAELDKASAEDEAEEHVELEMVAEAVQDQAVRADAVLRLRLARVVEAPAAHCAHLGGFGKIKGLSHRLLGHARSQRLGRAPLGADDRCHLLCRF